METIRSRGQALESLQNSIIFRSTPSDNGRLLKLAIDFFWTGSAVTTRFFDMIENTMEKAFYTVQKKKAVKDKVIPIVWTISTDSCVWCVKWEW